MNFLPCFRTHASSLALTLLIPVALLGCTHRLPPMSHAHIGHALTAWRDTPGEQGLFVVAEQEVAAAASAARNAVAEPSQATAYLGETLHALNPDRGPAGRKGYGAIRALRGSIDHVEFAAGTDDASRNVAASSAVFAERANALIAHLNDTLALTEQAVNAGEDERLAEDVQTIDARLEHALHGSDLDGDGSAASHPSEIGMQQLREQLSDMVNAETPAYAPVGKRYLFGVVRLPGGDWAYRFDRSGSQHEGY